MTAAGSKASGSSQTVVESLMLHAVQIILSIKAFSLNFGLQGDRISGDPKSSEW